MIVATKSPERGFVFPGWGASATGQVRPLAMHLSVGKTQYFPARLFLLTNGSCWPGSGSEVINLLA
jgi:hypothetical protein